MEHLSKNFWSDRYKSESTGWDLGDVSPPIKVFFDHIIDKDLKILIPGCGYGHEAEYLFNVGFKNVHIVDLVEEPLEAFKARVPDFPVENIHQANFLELKDEFDIIVEQTLFCAIHPDLRSSYAESASKLLRENGKLIGLLFNVAFESGPPYGGNKEEYMATFKPYFEKIKMENCYNSAPPRQGNELFIILQKN